MRLAHLRAEQLRRPSGAIAPLVALSLNRRNHGLIERSVAALDVRPGHWVLDVGFGGGLSLALLAGAVEDGYVAGIDPSPEMVARARRVLRRHIRRGRVSVALGLAEAVPFPDGAFDRVLTSQTVYFWDDLTAGLDELHRVLVPGGRLTVAMMPKYQQERFGFPEWGYRVLSHLDLMDALEHAGFGEVGSWPPGSEPGHSWIVTARRPNSGHGP